VQPNFARQIDKFTQPKENNQESSFLKGFSKMKLCAKLSLFMLIMDYWADIMYFA